jgi:hypothetical protein
LQVNGQLHSGSNGSGSSDLQGHGTAMAYITGQFKAPEQQLHGLAVLHVAPSAWLLGRHVLPLRAEALTAILGKGSLPPVRWLNEPQHNWRARNVAGTLELNAPYVRFTGTPESQRLLLEALSAALQ